VKFKITKVKIALKRCHMKCDLKNMNGLKTEKETEKTYSMCDKQRTTKTACRVCSKLHRWRHM